MLNYLFTRWSLGAVYYQTSVEGGASRNFSVGGFIVAGLEVSVDLLFLAPNYAFENAIWNGGQLSLSVTAVVGQMDVEVADSIDADLIR